MENKKNINKIHDIHRRKKGLQHAIIILGCCKNFFLYVHHIFYILVCTT